MKTIITVTALAFASLVSTVSAANFASEIISYNPGRDFSARYTNVIAALGEPSRVNPFMEETDPFNPPYGTAQVLSLGAGGSLTVKLTAPVLNHPRNRFGVDFMIYCNSGFIITNNFDFTTFTWIGEPATDGSLFGSNAGETRVSVSRDGENFFQLDSALSPNLDVLLPTDGAADFGLPADPQLTTGDFAGLTLAQIRALYHGSAGGTGFDLAAARDASGNPARLNAVQFIRVEVLSGKIEVDGFAGVFHAPGLVR
jgi:hypothetical protein